MNNMNGIISEAKHIFNDELNINDISSGSNRAVSFYTSVKARLAEEKAKRDSLEFKDGTSKIVTGEELRRYFDRNYDMEHPEQENQEQLESKEKAEDSIER